MRSRCAEVTTGPTIVDGAQLVKGYGDTHRRGVANFELIEQAYFNAERTAWPGATLADAIRRACQAALADPEGTALQSALANKTTPASPTSSSRQAAAITH